MRLSRVAVVVAAGAGLLAAAAFVDAALVEPYRLTTTHVELPDGGLAQALGGERVAHLSDLHLRGFGAREARLVDAISREDPALIVMTGDYADTSQGVAALADFLARLHPRLGVVAVPGNNDYFRGREEEIFAVLRGAGVTLLRNSSILVHGRQGSFAVAGVDDPFFGRDDVAEAAAGIPAGMPVLFLAHSPAVLEDRSEGMLFNAGDASGAWGAGSFWLDGAHLRGAQPAIAFESTGAHTLRIQRREDGVAVGAIRLIPAAGLSPGGPKADHHAAPPPAAGEIDIDPCGAGAAIAHGSWRVTRGEAEECVLLDGPDSGKLEASPSPDPEDHADIAFNAPAGIAYHVWVRLVSPSSTGRSDSIYVQFSDAIDPEGRPRYRIGGRVPRAEGPDVEVVLAGHTHGGQVRLPGLGPVEKNISGGRFVMGRYDIGPTMLYISRGIGTSYLPLRFDCAPELVLLSRDEAQGRERTHA